MDERILSLRMQAQSRNNVGKQKCDAVRTANFHALADAGQLTCEELAGTARQQLSGTFEGSISRYVTSVKLDLEARGVLERVPGVKPRQLHSARQ
jgi:hypothetical protein